MHPLVVATAAMRLIEQATAIDVLRERREREQSEEAEERPHAYRYAGRSALMLPTCRKFRFTQSASASLRAFFEAD